MNRNFQQRFDTNGDVAEIRDRVPPPRQMNFQEVLEHLDQTLTDIFDTRARMRFLQPLGQQSPGAEPPPADTQALLPPSAETQALTMNRNFQQRFDTNGDVAEIRDRVPPPRQMNFQEVLEHLDQTLTDIFDTRARMRFLQPLGHQSPGAEPPPAETQALTINQNFQQSFDTNGDVAEIRDRVPPPRQMNFQVVLEHLDQTLTDIFDTRARMRFLQPLGHQSPGAEPPPAETQAFLPPPTETQAVSPRPLRLRPSYYDLLRLRPFYPHLLRLRPSYPYLLRRRSFYPRPLRLRPLQ
uniref:uncharacterized protein LOC109974005 n=1 Tax=Monopterus albus TaxID=43700 RepID=UPI0009B4106D|nr:uncharacterized protein LOC109974005 [Monopterus albus]